MEFVAFEVDRANIGRRQTPDGSVEKRQTAGALCIRWNRHLVERQAGLWICPAYGHTGNYWLCAEQPMTVADATKILSESSGRGFAVFDAEEFLSWLASLKTGTSMPAVAAARRATIGAVIDLDPFGGPPPEAPPSGGFAFDTFALPRVRGAWKLDLTTPDGRTLDSRPEQREGGWGKLSTVMKRRYGGKWTARSMSTLDGVADAVR